MSYSVPACAGSGPNWEIADKLRQVQSIGLQIHKLIDSLPVNDRGYLKFTPAQALALQELHKRRRELRALIPATQIVVNNR